MVLLDANYTRFKEFLISSYMMRKLLEISNQKKICAICPSCNKLYKITEILNSQSDSRFKCSHVEFLNHPKHNQRRSCKMILIKKIPVIKVYTIRSKMVFSLPSLKMQIILMYHRLRFESLLRKWINQDVETDLMSDIYNSKI